METPHQPGRGNHEKHAGQPPPRDGQVRDCAEGHITFRTKPPHHQRCERVSESTQDDTQPESKPEAIDSGGECSGPITRTQSPRHNRCCGVGEKDQQTNDCGQHGAGEPEAREGARS